LGLKLEAGGVSHLALLVEAPVEVAPRVHGAPPLQRARSRLDHPCVGCGKRRVGLAHERQWHPGRPRTRNAACSLGVTPVPRPVCQTRIAMTVNLTRIYTRLGDGGETHLGNMSRVSKLHPRVEAYGTVDELNAVIGLTLLEPLPELFVSWLSRVQNDLLDVGADLSVPAPAASSSSAGAERPRLRVEPGYTEWLEQACDEVNAKLPPLRSFAIPGGA